IHELRKRESHELMLAALEGGGDCLHLIERQAHLSRGEFGKRLRGPESGSHSYLSQAFAGSQFMNAIDDEAREVGEGVVFTVGHGVLSISCCYDCVIAFAYWGECGES